MVRESDDKNDVISRLHISLVRFKRTIAREMQGTYNDVSLTPVQKELLFMLAKGTTRASDLAKASGATPSAVTQQVNHLEELGLVTRKTGKVDKRSIDLSLTSKAKELLKTRSRQFDQSLQKMTAHLSEQERQTLVELLEKMTRKETEN